MNLRAVGSVDVEERNEPCPFCLFFASSRMSMRATYDARISPRRCCTLGDRRQKDAVQKHETIASVDRPVPNAGVWSAVRPSALRGKSFTAWRRVSCSAQTCQEEYSLEDDDTVSPR